MSKKETDYMLCGIDEAGRGCLAGPLVVAGVILQNGVEGLADSKKLSEKRREMLYDQIVKNADYEVVFTDNKTIDEIGLSQAIKNSIIQIINALSPKQTIMDGNTSFGVVGVEAIIKADTKIPEVSAASILAKVSRDRYIVEQASNFPLYQFEKHKGYGTALHRELIKEHGYCDLHRRSFKIKGI